MRLATRTNRLRALLVLVGVAALTVPLLVSPASAALSYEEITVVASDPTGADVTATITSDSGESASCFIFPDQYVVGGPGVFAPLPATFTVHLGVAQWGVYCSTDQNPTNVLAVLITVLPPPPIGDCPPTWILSFYGTSGDRSDRNADGYACSNTHSPFQIDNVLPLGNEAPDN